LRTVAPLYVDEAEEFDPATAVWLVQAAEYGSPQARVQRISLQLKQIAAPFQSSNVQAD
jgi:hypothetical protein